MLYDVSHVSRKRMSLLLPERMSFDCNTCVIRQALIMIECLLLDRGG